MNFEQENQMQENSDYLLNGVLLSYLKTIADTVPREWTVRKFKNEFILPLTQGKHITYAQLLKNDEDKKHFWKEKADSFVSYGWDLSFADVISSLPLEEGDRFVWMDIFSSIQSTDEDFANSTESETYIERFHEVLKAIGRAELVIMPWKDPLPPKRSWCVFEYSVIVKENLDFQCRMAPLDKNDFKTHIKKNKTSSAFYMQLFGSINVLKAKAEKKVDEEKIKTIIEKVGVNIVNDAVMKGLKKWLDEVIKESLSEVVGKKTEEEANVLCAKGFLANVLGDLKEAQESFENSLEIHNVVTTSKNNKDNIMALKSNLAMVLVKKGNFGEAEPMLRDVYNYYNALKDVDVAQKLSFAMVSTNLGNLLRKLNISNEAEFCYLEAIKIYESESKNTKEEARNSKERPNITVCFNNLGRLYQDKNQHAKAIPLFQKALDIDTAFYGDGHVEVAMDLHNLARSLKEEGKKEEAREKGKIAVDTFVRVFGKDHPETKKITKFWSDRTSVHIS